jgi:hypothetical protein
MTSRQYVIYDTWQSAIFHFAILEVVVPEIVIRSAIANV